MSSTLTELLQTLPTEIIERILAFAASIDTRTALAVCSTNRLMRRTGTPILYHTLNIRTEENEITSEEREGVAEGPDDDEEQQLKADLAAARRVNAGMRKWSLLCRTILENRTLARHVHAVHAYLDDLSYEARSKYMPSRSLHHEALLKLVQEELTHTPVTRVWLLKWLNIQHQRARPAHRHEDGVTIFAGGSPPVFGSDVYLSILILACPRLFSITLSGPTSTWLEPLGELASALRLQCEPQQREWISDHGFGGFSSLQEVCFVGRYDDDPGEGTQWHPENVGYALRWPMIKSLTVGGLEDVSLPTDLGPAFHSTLTTLHLTDVIVPVEVFRMLLQPCRELTNFAVSWHEDWDTYREIDWRTLAATLVDFNQLLEQLSICVAPLDGLRDIFTGTIPDDFESLTRAERAAITEVSSMGLGSLTALKHLRKLMVPHFALFGVFDKEEDRDRDWTLAEMLPIALEELDIVVNGVGFKKEEMALLAVAGTENLSEMRILNCLRSKRYSRQLECWQEFVHNS